MLLTTIRISVEDGVISGYDSEYLAYMKRSKRSKKVRIDYEVKYEDNRRYNIRQRSALEEVVGRLV